MTTQIVFNNAVITKPANTMRLLLEPYLKACPFPNPPRFEDLFLTIYSGGITIPKNIVFADSSFIGIVLGAEYEYNADTRSSEVSILLDSLPIKTRRYNLASALGTSEVSGIVKLTLLHNLTGADTDKKWWINQVINEFCTKNKGTLIAFTNEFLETQPIIKLNNKM